MKAGILNGNDNNYTFISDYYSEEEKAALMKRKQHAAKARAKEAADSRINSMPYYKHIKQRYGMQGKQHYQTNQYGQQHRFNTQKYHDQYQPYYTKPRSPPSKMPYENEVNYYQRQHYQKNPYRQDQYGQEKLPMPQSYMSSYHDPTNTNSYHGYQTPYMPYDYSDALGRSGVDYDEDYFFYDPQYSPYQSEERIKKVM